MSVKNKAKDRDKNGRIKRKYTGPDSTYWLGHTPRWWVNLFMTRPKRRLGKKLCNKVMQGQDPDGTTFPPGNCKPHEYYW